MNNFHYALIRVVPDTVRMEPINIGIILQGSGRIDFKLNPHVARRKVIEMQIYQRWRKFFEEEISGPPVPLFQPPKDSPEFIKHLGNLCENTIKITRPLVHSTRDELPFNAVLESIYDLMVATPEQKKKEPDRPTSQFRQIEDEKEFRKRGMKKHPYIFVGGDSGSKHWNAYRQVLNGQDIVIDKIEVGNQVGLTADEIQKLSSGAENFLQRFLTDNALTGKPPRYYLIADQLVTKFSDQSDGDFAIMLEELDKTKATVRRLGGEVLDHPDKIIGFTEDLDRRLPQLAELS